MILNAPELDAQQVGLQTISIGQMGVGPVTVGELIINNVDLDVAAGPSVLHNVVLTLTLEVTIKWSITVPLPWPFHDVHLGSTIPLRPIVYPPMPLGDLSIPRLDGIKLHIPTLRGVNSSAAASPLTGVQLEHATAQGLQAHDVTLPSAGFSVAGLLLSSIQGSGVTVPAASVGTASIDRVRGDPIQVAEFSLGPVNAPSVVVPTIESTAPLDVPINLTPVRIHVPAGLLDVLLTIKASATSHIGQLVVNDTGGSTAIGQVILHNVVLPYDLLNLTLSTLGINNIAIPAFSVA